MGRAGWTLERREHSISIFNPVSEQSVVGEGQVLGRRDSMAQRREAAWGVQRAACGPTCMEDRASPGSVQLGLGQVAQG